MNFFIHHAGNPHFGGILSHFLLFTCGLPIYFSRDQATRSLMVPQVSCPMWILPMVFKQPIHPSDTFLTPLVHQSRENFFAFVQQLYRYCLAWYYFSFKTVMDFSILHWAPSFSCPKYHFSRYFLGLFFLVIITGLVPWKFPFDLWWTLACMGIIQSMLLDSISHGGERKGEIGQGCILNKVFGCLSLWESL